MHLVIQIPCHNEAEALPRVLASLPAAIDGVTRITTMVIDDGSTDGTADVARDVGVDQILSLSRRGGIARAFVAGIERAVSLGADLVVNIDGDGQHPGDRIADLVAPIVSGEAELVIGVRDEASRQAFPPIKRWLERWGSRVARTISGTEVDDAPSGFRALSREAAMRLHVFNRYTYTLETLIQAGQLGLAITTVSFHSRPAERPSRVVSSLTGYVLRQMFTMIRVFMVYRPFKFFAGLGVVSFLGALALAVRYLILYAIDGRAGRLQSLLLAAVLAGIGMALVVVGLLADLMAVNRRLLEDIDWRVKRLEHGGAAASSNPPA
jgi:glycosyltransferase involved in cell wall biosynthesis